MNFKIYFFFSKRDHISKSYQCDNIWCETDIGLLSTVNKHKVLLVSQFRRKLLYSTVTGLILTLTVMDICYCTHYFVPEAHIWLLPITKIQHRTLCSVGSPEFCRDDGNTDYVRFDFCIWDRYKQSSKLRFGFVISDLLHKLGILIDEYGTLLER